jgi:hypothetical protein
MQGEETIQIWDFVLKREYKEAMCVQEMVTETNGLWLDPVDMWTQLLAV